MTETTRKSRVAAELEAQTARVAQMTQGELRETIDSAARNFTALTLHEKLPLAQQGNKSPEAWRLRAEWRDAAEVLWLAATAELARR